MPAAHAAPVSAAPVAQPAPSVQPGLWESRRSAAQDLLAPSQPQIPTSVLLQTPDAVSAGFLPDPLRALPYKHGEIVKVGVSQSPNAPFVLLVQDARKSASAQRSIAGVLNHIQARMKSQRLFVGLEGFEGAYDINLYRAQRANLAQREVWNELIDKSLISGAEYFGLIADNEPVLWGAENAALYKQSFDAFQYGAEAEKDARRWIETVRADLDRVKSLTFGDELFQLDSLSAKFEAGEAGPAEILKFLRGMPEVSSGKYPEVEKYLALMQAEKEFSVNKVKEERDRVMKDLTDRLSRPELQQLLDLSFAHRVGGIGAGQYYAHLKVLLLAAGLKMSQYPAFSNYVQYALMSERIHPAVLSAGIRSLVNACSARLAATADQRQAVELTAQLRKVQKLVSLELSAEEWGEYQRSKEKISQLPVAAVLLKYNVERRYRGLAALSRERSKKPSIVNLSGYTELLSAYEGFYAAAQPRKQALAENFVREIRGRARAEVSVLVTGGFHTAALAEALEARGISYAIFRPRL